MGRCHVLFKNAENAKICSCGLKNRREKLVFRFNAACTGIDFSGLRLLCLDKQNVIAHAWMFVGVHSVLMIFTLENTSSRRFFLYLLGDLSTGESPITSFSASAHVYVMWYCTLRSITIKQDFCKGFLYYFSIVFQNLAFAMNYFKLMLLFQLS